MQTRVQMQSNMLQIAHGALECLPSLKRSGKRVKTESKLALQTTLPDKLAGPATRESVCDLHLPERLTLLACPNSCVFLLFPPLVGKRGGGGGVGIFRWSMHSRGCLSNS